MFVLDTLLLFCFFNTDLYCCHCLMTKPRTNRKAKSYAYLWQQYRSHEKPLLHCLIPYITCAYFNTLDIFYTALLWQREASDKSDISCNFKNKMCHFTDINGISWCLTQHLLIAGRVLRHKIWQYKTSITQDWHGTSLALPFAKVQYTCTRAE